MKVLSKNKIREKDAEEQKIKEENNKRIMRNDNKDEYELNKYLYISITGSSSVEHLVTLKTWMMMKDESKINGIFKTFAMEKFFDKESLMDVMYTLNKEAKICDKDYRLWFKLNEDANISVRLSL